MRAQCHSGLGAKRLELGIGLRPDVGVLLAFRGRKLEQMRAKTTAVHLDDFAMSIDLGGTGYWSA
jgi:hypothetical protein